MNATKLLTALFEADRKAQQAEAALLAEDPASLSKAIQQAANDALRRGDEQDASAQLVRLADLCAQLQGAAMADTLVRILNHDAPEVRVAAGEALRDFAYDRYAEVARAIERALEAEVTGPALSEVPWILAEIAEPSALPLIARCLQHSDAEVVASAIEALAELGEPHAIEVLTPLVNDARVVELQEGDAGYSTTIGELASEAIDELSGGAGE